MIIVGFVLLALAVAAAIVLIAQNPHELMTFHALGNTYTVHAYWVFVAGMVVLAVAAIGLSMMRRGASRGARVRRERRELAAENARLSDQVAAAPVVDERADYSDRVVTRSTDARTADDRAVVDDRRVASQDGPVVDDERPVDPGHHTWGRRSHRV